MFAYALRTKSQGSQQTCCYAKLPHIYDSIKLATIPVIKLHDDIPVTSIVDASLHLGAMIILHALK